MKANRKFVEGEKSVPLGLQAVSAVIGVILMVAITVAIAATVWYYVSTILPTTGGADYSVVAMYHSKNATANTITYSIETADGGLLWSKVTGTATTTGGTVTTLAAGNITQSPSTATNIEVGQTFTVSIGMDFTGMLKLVYDGTDSLWTSPSVTV